MLFDNDHNAVERIIRNLGACTTLQFTVYYHKGTAEARSYCIVEVKCLVLHMKTMCFNCSEKILLQRMLFHMFLNTFKQH